MVVLSSDIGYYLSGGASQSDPSLSLGGTRSSEAAPSTLNQLFALLEMVDNANEAQHVRCIYVRNNHSTDTLPLAVIFIEAQISGGAGLEIGLDPAGVNGTATTVADETEMPAGVTFSAPSTLAAALAIGNLGPESHVAVWLRRVATNSPSLDVDGGTLLVTGRV